MTVEIGQARDEMTAMLVAGLPVDTYIAFDDKPGSVPPEDKPWCRLTIRHGEGGQATLTDASAKKRFRRPGTLTVQLFTPAGGGLSMADNYIKMILDVFEGKASLGGIWFRNGRFREIGADGAFFQTNVLVDFTYDTIK